MIASLAGGDAVTGARIGLSMLGLQASIGTLNDLVDEPRDAGRKPGKPLPRGLVTRRVARFVAATTALVGLGLSAPSGIAAMLAAAGILSLGYLYDLRLSRTTFSWLPLAVALPILPIHAWLGATGAVAAGLIPLVPAAVLAGAALAIANGLVDLERDATSGRRGIAVALGASSGWLLHASLLAVVIALALLLAPSPATVATPAGSSGGPFEILVTLRSLGLSAGVAAIVIGALVLRTRSPALRERGWELEAVGVAAAGIAWLAGTALASRPA